MSNKTAECYEAVFKFIETNIFKLEPVNLMTDYESGMRKAILSVYAKSILRGCWFHFCAAIRTKCIRLGMNDVLNTNPNARFVQRQLMCIPLLPNALIEEGFAVVKKSAQNLKLTSVFRNLFDYFNKYWLTEVGIIRFVFNIQFNSCLYHLTEPISCFSYFLFLPKITLI